MLVELDSVGLGRECWASSGAGFRRDSIEAMNKTQTERLRSSEDKLPLRSVVGFISRENHPKEPLEQAEKGLRYNQRGWKGGRRVQINLLRMRDVSRSSKGGQRSDERQRETRGNLETDLRGGYLKRYRVA